MAAERASRRTKPGGPGGTPPGASRSGAELPRNPPPPDATRFLLVRHGQTDYNRDDRWQGARSDPPLNAAGRAQAEAVAEDLAGRPVAALYVSPQRRARETAALLAERVGVAPVVVDALRELDHGAWEGRTGDEVLRLWSDQLHRYEVDPLHFRRPGGGESYADLARRLWPALEELAVRHRGEEVAVVTHGGPVRLVLSQALDRPLTERHEFGVENGTVFAVVESGGRWRPDRGGRRA